MAYEKETATIDSTKSKLEQIRERQLYATAAGAIIGSMFGGSEGGASATGTIRKSMDDEYDTQLKELSRQETILEDKRRTDAMLASQIKLAKLSALTGLVEKGKSLGEGMAVTGMGTAQLANDLANVINGVKDKKSVDKILTTPENQKAFALLTPAEQKDILALAEQKKIVLDKGTGVGFTEKAGVAIQLAGAAFLKGKNPSYDVLAENLEKSAIDKARELKTKETSTAEKKRKGKDRISEVTTKSARQAAISRSQLGY
jgi:hypothetical protein